MADKFKFAEGVIDITFENKYDKAFADLDRQWKKVERDLDRINSKHSALGVSGSAAIGRLSGFAGVVTAAGGSSGPLDGIATSLGAVAPVAAAAVAAVSSLSAAISALAGASEKAEAYARSHAAQQERINETNKAQQGVYGDEKRRFDEEQDRIPRQRTKYDDDVKRAEEAVAKAEAMAGAARNAPLRPRGWTEMDKYGPWKEKQAAIEAAENVANRVREAADRARQAQQAEREKNFRDGLHGDGEDARVQQWRREESERKLAEDKKAREEAERAKKFQQQERESRQRAELNKSGEDAVAMAWLQGEHDRIAGGMAKDQALANFRGMRGGIEGMNSAIQDRINQGVADDAQRRLDEANKHLIDIEKAAKEIGGEIRGLDMRARAG